MERNVNWFRDNLYAPIQNGSIDGTDVTPHDHGIIRALKARYSSTKDSKIKGDPLKTLFVGRLNLDTTEETLYQVFSKYGKILDLRLVQDVVTGISRGYAFITFQDERDFKDAFRFSNHMIVDGRQILVDFERERLMKGWIPRRYGGGLGGKKESGQLRFGGRDRPFKKPVLQPIPQFAFKRFDEGWRDRFYDFTPNKESKERDRERERIKDKDKDHRTRSRERDSHRSSHREKERERSRHK